MGYFNGSAGGGTIGVAMRPISGLSPGSQPAPEPAVQWIEGCRAGNRRDIEQLFLEYAGYIERVIGRFVGPTADLEDLVQTTFLQAIQTLARFRGEASFKTWLTSIAVHVAHHHLRAGRVRRHVPLEAVPESVVAQQAVDSDRQIDGRRLAPRLHQLLDTIAPKKRIALLLYVVDGLSIEEVASLMGATQTATRSRIFFARREMRALLGAAPDLRALASALLERAGGEAQ
ncbi:MAG: RNA polymerase sigma factor [Myxococcales bacterium]|nr:RNA polymerase sigma factor [Myxococcales bacterium]